MNDSQPEAVTEEKKHPLEILWYPDTRLTNPNKPIEKWTQELDVLTKKMFELMYKTDGIGLAAPQVGENLQLFVMNTTPKDKTNERVYWNPKITNLGPLILDIEGCLSFPTISAKIKRYQETILIAETPEGRITTAFRDLDARAIQHEIDHLEGMLFIERMTPADQKKNAYVLKQLRYRMAAIKNK